MPGIGTACRRPPAVRPRDRNGGFPRLSDGVARGLRGPASPRPVLLAENLGKPSLWVDIKDLWYKPGGDATGFIRRPPRKRRPGFVMDGRPRCCKGKPDLKRRSSLQSWMRPFHCGTPTAGPDGLRKFGAPSDERARCSDKASGLADLGHPVSPSNRRDPRKAGTRLPAGQAGVGRVIRSDPSRAQATRAVLLAPGDQHDVCRPPRQQPLAPARPRAWFGAAPAEHGSCGLYEQAPDSAIPTLRYPPQSVLAATGVLPGHETEPGRELSARAELRAIADRHRPRPARARSAPAEPPPGPAPADPATATATGPRIATATGAPRSPSPAQDAPPSAPRSCDSPVTEDPYNNAGKAHGGPFGPAHAPNPQI